MHFNRDMGGFERWASGIASTAMGSWGIRRGGLFGLLALAGAGFLAWRAGTGRSLLPLGALPEKVAHALPAPKTPRRSRRAKASKAAAPRRRAVAKSAQSEAPKTASAAPKRAAKAGAKPSARASRRRTTAPKAANASATTH